MKSQIKKKTKGFTLVETIMYVAILGIVATSFVSFSISIATARNKNYAVEEVQANARIILAFIADKIKGCEEVITPNDENESAFLELKMPDSDDHLFFSVENGTVLLSYGENTPINISSSEVFVNSLLFENNAVNGEKDSVAISLDIRYRFDSAPEFAYTFLAQTSVSARL